MGCGSLRSACCRQQLKETRSQAKAEKVLRAALLIQRWYRRVHSRLEAREQNTWNIFQSLEYAGEQDQMKLYNFFTDMLKNVNIYASKDPFEDKTLPKDVGMDADQLFRDTDPAEIVIEPSYKGPHLTFPLTSKHIDILINAFKQKQMLHCKYTIRVLHEASRLLMRMPNITRVSTALSKCITICGDLHGKLSDMFIIFYKNGLPTKSNPYLFNGDFVDRGPQSLEIVILLFSMMLVDPHSIFLNRGNHEDSRMNRRYGFEKEIESKYGKKDCRRLMMVIDSVFSWLPLATIIDKKVFVIHGGVSSRTDLSYLDSIDRHKYVSVLWPPTITEGPNIGKVDVMEWRQLLDILWSDPRPTPGCHPNTFRGGGSFFGPDVTAKFLRKNQLSYVIRSHECKAQGYEYEHNNMVLTIFSASNYYELGSNKGAYIRLEQHLKPRIIQYIDTRGNKQKQLSIKQRVSLIEESAMTGLMQKIFALQSNLLSGFEAYDTNNDGYITVQQWSSVMQKILGIELPWRSLMSQLVKQTDTMVEYTTTFNGCRISSALVGDTRPAIMETLYRNKDNLETLFRALDKDNSGLISMVEFTDACKLLSEHLESSLTSTQVMELARTIDLNNDGYIDFNEFLEAFRIVDQRGLQVASLPRLCDSEPPDSGGATSYSVTSLEVEPRWKVWKRRRGHSKESQIYTQIPTSPSVQRLTEESAD